MNGMAEDCGRSELGTDRSPSFKDHRMQLLPVPWYPDLM